MPIYQYLCPNNHRFEQIKVTYRDFERNPVCEIEGCGSVAEFAPTSASMDYDWMWRGYYSVSQGKWFYSKSQFNDHIKQKGLAVWDEGVDKDIKRHAREEDERHARERKEAIWEETLKHFDWKEERK